MISGSTERLGIYHACQFGAPSSIVNGVEILRICKLSIYKVDEGLNQWRCYDKSYYIRWFQNGKQTFNIVTKALNPNYV